MNYKLVNIYDPNDQIELVSDSREDALFEGLEMVGWLLCEDNNPRTEN